MSKRLEFVKRALDWVGTREGSVGHKQIVADYNKACDSGRKMDMDSYWCAGFVGAVAEETDNVLKDGIGVPVDCSCGTGPHSLIEKAKVAGIWVENDAYIPTCGDVIIYDWADSGIGDDTSGHDHTGIVTIAGEKSFTVTEGNKNNAVGNRVLTVNGKYIRGFITPRFADETETCPQLPSEKPVKPTKSIEEVAREVISGKWGNNPERKQRLTEEGYDYNAVQAEVNRILKSSTTEQNNDKQKYRVKTNTGKPLRLRAKPSTNSRVLDKIKNGKTITVNGVQNGWAHTSYNGHVGYCSMTYLVKI